MGFSWILCQIANGDLIFQDRRFQPLTHPSGVETLLYCSSQTLFATLRNIAQEYSASKQGRASKKIPTLCTNPKECSADALKRMPVESGTGNRRDAAPMRWRGCALRSMQGGSNSEINRRQDGRVEG